MNDRLSQVSFGAAPAALASTRAAARLPGRRRPRRRRLSQRLKRGLVGGSFLAVTSLIAVVLMLLRPPHPATLVLVGADYAENLAVPDNAPGWNGLNKLSELARPQGGGGFLSSWRQHKMRLGQEKVEPLKAKGDWHKDWGPFATPTVIVYIDLYGGVDENGPYLLADRGLDERIPLKDVFQFLKDDKQVQGRNKVVLLDATKVMAHEPLTLHNDFVRRLKDDLKGALDADKRLVVICASGEGERSWASEEWGKSIFAQKVIEGLQGAADEEPKDTRINALELYRYVKKGVATWAWDNRRARQEPILLPGDEEGERRARGMEVALTDGTYRAPSAESAPGAAFAPPAWLTTAWDERDGLLKEAPAPYVYAPHLWQEYQQVLLRCESLARAGYDENTAGGAVAHLLARRTKLKEQIERAGRLELSDSVGYSLARGDVAGLPPAPNEFAEVWKVHYEAQDDKKKDKAPAPKADEDLLKWVRGQEHAALARLSFHAWLYNKVAEGDAADLPRRLEVARELGRLVSGSGNNPPTEALFLAMLAHHIPKDVQQQRAALIQTALRVRRLAERVALGIEGPAAEEAAALGERVVPLIRGKVEAADHKRRLAEDRLFAGSARDLEQSAELFQAAEKAYREAAGEAGAVRHALWVSARAHADLPHYCAWLAASDGDKLRDFSDLMERAQRLWVNTHELDKRLLTTDDRRAAAAEGPSLKERADGVAADLKVLDERFKAECADLRTHAERRQDTWLRLNAALAVPLLAGDERKELLKKSRDVSDYLNEHTGQGPAGQPESVGDKKARDIAQRHGWLAVSAIGAARFDRDAASGAVRFDQARRSLQWGEQGWERELAPVSRQVSQLMRGTAEEITARDNDARKEAKPEKALDELAQADAACRQVWGGLLAEGAPNPVELRRRWQAHDLLVWQARRALLDRWWTEEQTEYYKPSGRAYLADAEKVLGEDDSPFATDGKERRRQLSSVLEQPSAYRFELTQGGEGQKVYVAGKDELKVDCNLVVHLPPPSGYAPPKDEPLGVVTVRLNDNGLGQGARDPAGVTQPGREIFPEPHEPTSVSQSLTKLEPLKLLLGGKPTAGERTTYRLAWEGFLRGKEFKQSVDVEVQPGAATVIAQLPVPPVAGITVRPDNDLKGGIKGRQGILVVVLDLTGSMKLGKLKDGTTRRVAAIKALDAVLADVEEGTIVSVMTFGQDSKGGANGPTDFQYSSPEDSIRTQWPRTGPPAPWRKADRKKLIDILDALNPCLETPLARAIRESRKRFDEAKEQLGGAATDVKKTLLVLTDGEDNRFNGDVNLQRDTGATTIPDLLKKSFAGTGISINMVLLSDNQKEKANAREQFRDVICNRLRPRGSYFDADIPDPKELARALREAMGLRATYLLENGSEPEAPLGARDTVSRDLYWSEFPGWHYHYFKAGEYSPGLRTRLNLDIRQPVRLAPGELLFLKQTARGFYRATVSDEKEFSDRPRDPQAGWKKGWRMTDLRYLSQPDSSRVLLMALERETEKVTDPDPERLPVAIQQARPRTLWLQVTSEGGGTPEGVQWAEERGSAAPIWKIQVPPRAGGTAVNIKEITAWVSRSSPEDFAKPIFPDRDRAPKDLKVVAKGEVSLGTRKIEVEVSEQRHEVIDGLGTRIPDFPCLVVRAEYDNLDDPIRAVLPYDDPARIGAEHHYYTAGNRGVYKGVFWFLDPNRYTPEKQAADLMLMSVERFRNDPGTTKLSLTREQLGAPDKEGAVVISELTDLKRLQDLARDLPHDDAKPAKRGEGP